MIMPSRMDNNNGDNINIPLMPSLQRLQRELADSIIRQAPLDEIRILLACGAKVNEPVTQGMLLLLRIMHLFIYLFKKGLRPLHYATYQRYEKAVNLLLVRGCDVDAMDDVGYTALHLSAERGYNELMNLLIEHGARIKFTELRPDDKALGNPPRATIADEPLRLAIKNGHLECAEILLKNGADPNARYFLGSEINLISPLNVMCLEMLLKYGAIPDSRDRSGLTPLMKACRHPQGYAAAKILIYHGADVNAITSERHDYRSVLHYAVLSNNIDIVRLLLHHGANARYIFPTATAQKPTPLDFALLSGNVEMVKLLIDAGADVNVGSPIIGRPLHIVLSEKAPNKAELIDLLLEAGADPNAITNDARGPLLKPPIGEYFNANEPPQAFIVRKLLKYGAKIVIKAQVHDRIGILKVINRLDLERDKEVINLVLEAADAFNVAGIKRCSLLNERLRERILQTATKPQPLLHLCRQYIRKILYEISIQAQSNMMLKARSIQCPLYVNRTINEIDDLSDIELERLNRMTIDEIEDAFITGGNGDPERLKLLTILLRRQSIKPSPVASLAGTQVIERIENLLLPDILKRYLNYEISFTSIHELMAAC
ncbi:uncharacterized protein LOC113798829 isoform X3 [Dermatophagoides pteronyssinus]|uniref:uncharacterized protein LOC113798829 isoform X3 n=1 Tax=Dermatophagoides pteronyssinus TaxID=6956 RepID=UPI003F67F101